MTVRLPYLFSQPPRCRLAVPGSGQVAPRNYRPDALRAQWPTASLSPASLQKQNFPCSIAVRGHSQEQAMDAMQCSSVSSSASGQLWHPHLLVLDSSTTAPTQGCPTLG